MPGAPIAGDLVTLWILLAGLRRLWIDTGIGDQCALIGKTAHVADLCREVRTDGIAATVHSHDDRVLRELLREAPNSLSTARIFDDAIVGTAELANTELGRVIGDEKLIAVVVLDEF